MPHFSSSALLFAHPLQGATVYALPISTGSKFLLTRPSRGATRIAFSFGLLAALMVIGRLFLPGYEDHQYYTDVYGVEGMFGIFMTLITVAAIVCALLAVTFMVIYSKIESKKIGDEQ